jgi:hypothetical protein
VDEQELPEEGDAENFALGNPAEIERHMVERADVDHGLVVEYDDVTLAAVDVLQPLHPTGERQQKTQCQIPRHLVNDAPRLLERVRQRQHRDRQDEDYRTDRCQPDVVQNTQHASCQ